MSRTLRFIIPFLTVLVLSGCGGSDGKGESGERASAGTDVNALLRSTFTNLGRMKSATVDVKLRIEPRGANAAAAGPVAARLHGPFASQGPNKLPKFAFNAELVSGGQTVSGGATYTGQKAFISLQGTPYEVSDLVLRQFVAGYEQALKSRQGAQGGLVLGALGIDFRKWLKSPRNEGEAQVGDAETIKVTGSADVARVVADLGKISERAASLPGAGGRVPQTLTPELKQRVTNAIKAVDVAVYTGAEDRILRRLTVSADLKDTQAKVDAALLLDITFTKVGQKQQIEAPAGARPFTELLKALDAAGFADLGLGGTAGNSDPAPQSPPGTANNVDKYARCIEEAKGDRAKARKCAELLSG